MSIFSAIASGNAEAVEALLKENNARASERDENGVSAIMFALYVRERAIARRLAEVKRRLDVFEAASLGDTTQLAVILEKDPLAAVDWSPDGFTALHLAAFLGNGRDGDDAVDAGAERLRRVAERDAGAAAAQRRRPRATSRWPVRSSSTAPTSTPRSGTATSRSTRRTRATTRRCRHSSIEHGARASRG